MRVLGALAIAIGVFGGLAAAATSTPRLATIRCDDIIDERPAPSATQQVVFDHVAVPKRSSNLDRRGGWYWSKQGFEVRRGATAVDIFVPRLWRARAAYGGHVLGCPQEGGGEWLAYPAIFRVRRPMCLPLTIRMGTRWTVVRVSVGAPCPSV